MGFIERILKAIVAVPVLGTCLFIATDAVVLVVLVVGGRTDLARLMWFRIWHGTAGWRRELRIGLNFYRYVEYPRVIEWVKADAGDRILDIGASYSILPLWYVDKGCDVWATDLTDQSFGEWRDAVGSSLLHCQRHDARRMGFASSSFDWVMCISTVEHIEEDSDVAREISRVLKPGGTAVLTFPINCTKHEMRDNPEFGLVRMYDETMVADRIVGPSGLEIVAREVWPVRDPYAQAPLWTYSRFSSVLKTFKAYPRTPQTKWPKTPNTLGHHICVLALTKPANVECV